MDKICKVCGKTFERPPHKAGNIKCCSVECMEVLRRRHDRHGWDSQDALYHGICKHCGEAFTSSRKRMYCSPECCTQHNQNKAAMSRMKPKGLCRTCGKTITKNRWIYCSDECNPKFNKEPQIILTDEMVRERIAERYDHITHISGHESDGTIKVKCKVCGLEFITGERASRVTRVIRCRRCYGRERRRKEAERKKRYAAIQLIWVIKKRIAYLEDIEYRTRTCEVCGKEFIMQKGQTGVKLCSIDCMTQRKREVKRNQRHTRRAKYNSSSDMITLRELYEKDNGTCYLCGKQCDYEDISWQALSVNRSRSSAI